MKIFRKVTLQTLKENKTRTTVTIVGIILSAAMICAVTTFTSSMQDYLLRVAIYNNGNWSGRITNTELSVYQKLVSSDQVSAGVYLQQLGFAYAEGCTNEYKPYLYIVGGSAGTQDMLPIHITAGTYPQSESELLLPNHLAKNGGVIYHLGDTLTLALGTRMLDGSPVPMENPVYEGDALTGETLEIQETRSYTVCGFYERLDTQIEPTSFPGYTAITTADEKPASPQSYDIYFRLAHPKNIYDFMEEGGYAGSINRSVLLFQGISHFTRFYSVLLHLAAIVIALIMFGSVSLIYNAFSISVSERTRQFGLLASVGATRKQLRKMVFFEALCVSLAGIPLGILSGIAGIHMTLCLLGSRLTSWMGNAHVSMRTRVSPAAIVIAAVTALITVLISAWIPSRRASKVSAVEAIRQTLDIRTVRPIKTPRFTYKLFGIPGVLASKHYKRSKKKYRATVMSLFMSIVLFVAASAFTDYLVEAFHGGMGGEKFDLLFSGTSFSMADQNPDDILALLCTGQDVTAGSYALRENANGIIPAQYVNDGLIYDSDDYDAAGIFLFFIPDKDFKELLSQYHLNEKDFMDPKHPLAITVDGHTHFNVSEQKYVTRKILKDDYCEITGRFRPSDSAEESGLDDIPFSHYPLYSGKTIYENPYYIYWSGDLEMIYPISLYNDVMPKEAHTGYNIHFCLLSDDHNASYTDLSRKLIENGLSDGYLYDYAQAAEEDRNTVLSIRVFAYGFVALISLIAIANVFNTISTNIGLRRREFAMLRSVGMTSREFKRMLNYECLLYSFKALLLGLPVSCAVTWLIYRAITDGYETTLRLPWGAMGIASLSVFLVVFITMLYSGNKIRKENLIDTLKNENL